MSNWAKRFRIILAKILVRWAKIVMPAHGSRNIDPESEDSATDPDYHDLGEKPW